MAYSQQPSQNITGMAVDDEPFYDPSLSPQQGPNAPQAASTGPQPAVNVPQQMTGPAVDVQGGGQMGTMQQSSSGSQPQMLLPPQHFQPAADIQAPLAGQQGSIAMPQQYAQAAPTVAAQMPAQQMYALPAPTISHPVLPAMPSAIPHAAPQNLGQGGLQQQPSLQSLLSQDANAVVLDEYGQPIVVKIPDSEMPEIRKHFRSRMLGHKQQSGYYPQGSLSSIGTAGSLGSATSARSVQTQSDLNLIAECLEMMGVSGRLSNAAHRNLQLRMQIIDLEMEAAEKKRELARQGWLGKK